MICGMVGEYYNYLWFVDEVIGKKLGVLIYVVMNILLFD